MSFEPPARPESLTFFLLWLWSAAQGAVRRLRDLLPRRTRPEPGVVVHVTVPLEEERRGPHAPSILLGMVVAAVLIAVVAWLATRTAQPPRS